MWLRCRGGPVRVTSHAPEKGDVQQLAEWRSDSKKIPFPPSERCLTILHPIGITYILVLLGHTIGTKGPVIKSFIPKKDPIIPSPPLHIWLVLPVSYRLPAANETRPGCQEACVSALSPKPCSGTTSLAKPFLTS